jgi:hypothetical protein
MRTQSQTKGSRAFAFAVARINDKQAAPLRLWSDTHVA